MPYLILIIGILVGALALYMWFLNTETIKVKNAIRGVAIAFYALILILFAVTGRLPISILLLVVAFPFLLSYLRSKNKTGDEPNSPQDIKIIEAEEITEYDESDDKNEE